MKRLLILTFLVLFSSCEKRETVLKMPEEWKWTKIEDDEDFVYCYDGSSDIYKMENEYFHVPTKANFTYSISDKTTHFIIEYGIGLPVDEKGNSIASRIKYVALDELHFLDEYGNIIHKIEAINQMKEDDYRVSNVSKRNNIKTIKGSDRSLTLEILDRTKKVLAESTGFPRSLLKQ